VVAGPDRADLVLRSTEITNPSEATVVRFSPKDAKSGESVVPDCQTNSRGFTHFVARKPGKYHLVNEDVPLDDNAWYDAATVFKEIRKISDIFVRYRNIGAVAHNCTDKTPYLRFSNPVRTFPTIQQIQCDDPLLVGCFCEKGRPRNRLHDRPHVALTGSRTVRRRPWMRISPDFADRYRLE
jgi:hypothetical protein